MSPRTPQSIGNSKPEIPCSHGYLIQAPEQYSVAAHRLDGKPDNSGRSPLPSIYILSDSETALRRSQQLSPQFADVSTITGLCLCCASLAPTVPGALPFSVPVIILRVAWGWRPYHLPAKVLSLAQVSSCGGPIAPGLWPWPTVLVDRSKRRCGQPSGRAFR